MSETGESRPATVGGEAPAGRAAVPWRGILIAMGLGFVVYVALGVVADLQRVRAALAEYAWWTLGVGLCLAFSNYLLRFLKWQYYLRTLGIRVESGPSLRVFLGGLVMSVTPAKVGEVLRSVLLHESHGVPVERTAPIVVADRLSDMLALLVLMVTGAFVFSEGWAVLVAGAGLCLLVVVAVQIPAVGRGMVRLAARLPFIRRAADKLDAAYEALRTVGSARALLLPVLLSVAAWGCECLAFYLILGGLPNGHVDLFVSTFVYSLATVAGAVAMLPGGLGATEASMAGLLVTLSTGLGPGEAAAATVLVRAATLWFAVVVGLVALGLHRRAMAARRGR